GLDSLMAVEMRNRLAAALGMTLPSTLLFNYPSVEALTAYIGGSLDDADTDTAATATASEPLPAGVLTAELDTLTEDEVANLLEEKRRQVCRAGRRQRSQGAAQACTRAHAAARGGAPRGACAIR